MNATVPPLIPLRPAGQECWFGAAVSLMDPAVTEMLGFAGFNFAWIDMEHTALERTHVLSHIMAAAGAGIASFVRVAANDPVLVKPILDMGPAGVIFPCIRSAADAQAAVAACEYPPAGIRGVGPKRAIRYGCADVASYLSGKSTLLKIVQLEHVDILSRLGDIASVPGVDAWMIGPSDLAASMGYIGNESSVAVQDAIDAICAAAQEHGMLLGAFTGDDPTALQRWRKRGVQLFTLGGDTGYLLGGARRSLRQGKDALGL